MFGLAVVIGEPTPDGPKRSLAGQKLDRREAVSDLQNTDLVAIDW